MCPAKKSPHGKPRAPSKEGLQVTVVGTFEFLEDNDTVKPTICAAGCGTNSGHSWNAKRKSIKFRFCIQLTSDERFVQMTAKQIARTVHQRNVCAVLEPSIAHTAKPRSATGHPARAVRGDDARVATRTNGCSRGARVAGGIPRAVAINVLIVMSISSIHDALR